MEANWASGPFMIEFSDAIATGALRALKGLNFSLNRIGDDGVKSFAGACAKAKRSAASAYSVSASRERAPGGSEFLSWAGKFRENPGPLISIC